MAHPDRGFDIRPTTKRRRDQWHELDQEGIAYQIWSNELGCFDQHHASLGQRFMYFAGDSTTWGYAPYESKFAAIFEKTAGIQVLKCGVSHTGQLHQFSKFLEISSKINRWPTKVVVFYSPNDVANDYAHPHSTVVAGGLFDNAWLDETNKKVVLGQDWINQVNSRTEASEGAGGRVSNGAALKYLILKLSMTAQIFNAAAHYGNKSFPILGTIFSPVGQNPFLHWSDQYEVHKGQKIFDIHRLSYLQARAGIYKYKDFPYAAANKSALFKWRDHASRNNYKLEIVLMPPGEVFGIPAGGKNTDFYKELKLFLKHNGIEFHDLAEELRSRGIKPSSIFWDNDPHPSIDGNILIGRLLADVL